MHEETFETAARSAFAGGTTTVIPFAPQFKGSAIAAHAGDDRARAARAPIDYALHQIVTDPTAEVLDREVPASIAEGVRSLKVFLTYDPLHIDDRQFLAVLSAAKRVGATVCVHCENTRRSAGAPRRCCVRGGPSQEQFEVLELFSVAAIYYLAMTTAWQLVQRRLERYAGRSDAPPTAAGA